MKLGLLDPAWLPHPCELVFDVFLAHRDIGRVMYLSCYRDTALATGNPVASGFLQTVSLTNEQLERSDFRLLVRMGVNLPCGGGECDLIVLRCDGHISSIPSLLGALLGEVERVLAPDGEVLLLCRESTLSSATGYLTNGTASRWWARARGALDALDRRWWSVLRRALRKNGFEHAEWLAAEYTASGMPSHLHLLSAGNALRSRRGWSDWIRISALRSVAVRAAREPLPSSWMQLANTQIRAALGEPDSPLVVKDILVSPKEKLVLLGELADADIVIRVPLSESARKGCQQNMQMLQGLQKEPRLAALGPMPLFESEAKGRYFAVESRMRGTPVRYLAQDEQQLELVERLLHTFNPQHGIEIVQLRSELFDSYVGRTLESVASRYLDAERWQLLDNLLRRSLYGIRACVGLIHGDFSVRNIYLNDGGMVGVIDWDDASIRGLPALDAVGHLLSRQSRRGQGFADSYRRLATRQWPREYELRFLDRCYAYYAAEPDQHVAWVMLHWLRVVDGQSQYWFAQTEEFAAEHVDGLVAFFLQITGQTLD